MTGARTNCGNAVTVYAVYEAFAHVAKDGTKFITAQFYCVASRNIGILRIDSDGTRTAYANTLYANPANAERVAKEMCDAYEKSLEGYNASTTTVH